MKANLLSGLVFGVLLANSMTATAGRPVEAGSDWYSLEQKLQDEGLPIDIGAVIQTALSNPDSGIRWTAVELLGRRGDSPAKPALEKVLANDEDQIVKEAAALALARLGQTSAFSVVEEMMREGLEPRGKLYLATQLADFKVFSGYPSVVEAAGSEDPLLRVRGLGSLMRFLVAGLSQKDSEPDPLALLEKLLSDPAEQVRKEAVFQLSLGLQRGFAVAPFVSSVQGISKDDASSEVQEQARLFLASWEESKRGRVIP